MILETRQIGHELADMRDYSIPIREELLPVGEFEMLPDTIMMLSGECFKDFLPKDFLPKVSGAKRGPKSRPGGGYGRSVHFSQAEIDENPMLALSPEEYRTLRLHMQGLKPKQIAEMLGITEQGVHMRLRKNRVRTAKAAMMEDLDSDLEALMTKAVDVYRDGLAANGLDMRMKAADRVMRVNGKGQPARHEQSKENMSAAVFMNTLLQNIETRITADVRPAKRDEISGSISPATKLLDRNS